MGPFTRYMVGNCAPLVPTPSFLYVYRMADWMWACAVSQVISIKKRIFTVSTEGSVSLASNSMALFPDQFRQSQSMIGHVAPA